MNDLFAKLPESDTTIEDEYYRRYTLQNFLEMVDECPIREIDPQLNWN